jgi:hypothetical protein
MPELHPVGTVCRTHRDELVLITGHNPNRPKNIYRGVKVHGEGTEYIWPANAFAETVPGYDTSRVTLPSDQHSDTYAGRMALLAPEHQRAAWALIAGVSVGGTFRARTRSGVQTVTLRAVKPNAPKYPINIVDAKGKNIRCHISCVVVEGTTLPPPPEAVRTVKVGDTYDLLVMDSCETVTVNRIAMTPWGSMARMTHGGDERFLLVEALTNNHQM